MDKSDPDIQFLLQEKKRWQRLCLGVCFFASLLSLFSLFMEPRYQAPLPDYLRSPNMELKSSSDKKNLEQIASMNEDAERNASQFSENSTNSQNLNATSSNNPQTLNPALSIAPIKRPEPPKQGLAKLVEKALAPLKNTDSKSISNSTAPLQSPEKDSINEPAKQEENSMDEPEISKSASFRPRPSIYSPPLSLPPAQSKKVLAKNESAKKNNSASLKNELENDTNTTIFSLPKASQTPTQQTQAPIKQEAVNRNPSSSSSPLATSFELPTNQPYPVLDAYRVLEYEVQKDDNLYKIAGRFFGNYRQSTIEKIKNDNQLLSDKITTGMRLTLLIPR